MRTRHNPESARITSSHFDHPGAHEPVYDFDGRIIYTPEGFTRLREETAEVDQWIANLQRNTPRRVTGMRYQHTSEPFHERRDAEAGMIGRWWRRHGRRTAKARGTFYAAQRLRKYGVPLHVALLVLT